MLLLPLGLSFFLSLIFVPITRWLGMRIGLVAQPRADRWNRRPTPKTGGVALFFAFAISVISFIMVNGEDHEMNWGMFVGLAIVFSLGLYDDLRPLSPATKLLFQILASTVVIFSGYTTDFFTTRIPDASIAQLLDISFTLIWLVSITNAINLLDNMDGLAGGVSLITVVVLGFFFWRAGNENLLGVALALAGSLLGFLIFNFPPASIFMGDSGSLFLGFTLALLSIARQPQASNVFAIVGVPSLLFLLPILDTAMVTFTRLLRGQSPGHGGTDHTSHRLIAFGLTERQAVLVLYAIACISGVMAALLESINYWISLLLAPMLVLSLALLAAYLGRIKVVTTPVASQPNRTIARFMSNLTYRQHLLEVIFDFFLTALVYYLAFLTRYGLVMNTAILELCLDSLPLAWASTYLSFILFGVYRGVWRYVGLDDLLRFGKSSLGAIALMSIAVWRIYSFQTYSLTILVWFSLYLFLALSASRSSFKVLDQVFASRVKQHEERVLICGADDSGELVLQWILMNPQLGYRPVGFLDDDIYKYGQRIHGIEILGNLEQLEMILEEKQINGVIVTANVLKHNEVLEKIVMACRSQDCWVRTLHLDLELVA
jgi:UDP-GlcNAc:undecaprenyl-phosphate GlcNAc-1-phosphate transferase